MTLRAASKRLRAFSDASAWCASIPGVFMPCAIRVNRSSSTAASRMQLWAKAQVVSMIGLGVRRGIARCTGFASTGSSLESCIQLLPFLHALRSLTLCHVSSHIFLALKHLLEVLLIVLHMADHACKYLFICKRRIRVCLKVLNPGHEHAIFDRLIQPGEMHVEKRKLWRASLGNGNALLEIQNTP